MKALVEKLAAGNSIYEIPDAEISENRIAVELEGDNTVKGEIIVTGKNGMNVKGVAFSSDNHVTFENNQFNGVNNKIIYIVSGKNIDEGQICSGTISVVTTAGDYAIPFAITRKKRVIDSTMGEITQMSQFVKLVQVSYDEALILFLSKEFKEYFLDKDMYALTLYNQVMKNTNRSIALEEFLVGMGLKDRVKINVLSTIREYTDVTENYADVITVTKSCWGYVDIDVEAEGDFLYNCKTKITGDDFNGKVAEYQYYINSAKLHGSSNLGRITFKTTDETLTYDIVIVNQKENIENYINKKKNSIGLIKNYLDFRTGVINGNVWMDEMTVMADERLKNNEDDIVGLLAKAQVAILREKNEEATGYLNTVSGLLAIKQASGIKEAASVETYCYYLYLKTLYKNSSHFTDDIKAEIKTYFEGGYDTWQLLWMLFYMDERYDENPSLKYTMIKRMFNNGCFSPVMYFEAANVINKQPELLRVINKFEVQVLNFAGKYHMVTKELAKQAAEIIEKEKTYSDSYFNILSRMYQETQCVEVLQCICTMLINGNIRDREYSEWFREGVKKELKITNLYEYYIYTIDTSNYEPLEKSAYKYFAYGTDTLAYNRDYFFANLLTNFEMTDDTVLKYREDMEKYVTEELLRGHNNKHLRVIYSKVVTDDFIVGEMPDKMPEVLHTYRVIIKNENIRNIVIRHKETEHVQTVAIDNGEAYIQLYSENPVITFMDNRGRFLAKTEYELEKMSIGDSITKIGANLMTEVCNTENIMKNPVENRGQVLELKNTLEIPFLTKEFKDILRDFIVDYYYNDYDENEMDIYILQFNMNELSIKSRNKIMEILIRRNLTEMVYPYVAKYGYQCIKSSLLEKMCIELVSNEDYANNELLVEMCGVIFRNGCRDEKILRFLSKHYESGSLELYQLFLALKSKEIEDNTLSERLLVQYMFEGNSDDKIYDIYWQYLKGATSTKVRKAFYTYVTFNYFIKKMQCPDMVWEILEQEYENGLTTPMICSIAFIEAMSEREKLTEKQIDICQKLMESLAKNNVNFEFYKRYNKWFKIPYNLVDKTIIDFRTNPKHKVDITYYIKTLEGTTNTVTEEMGSIYQGVFTKEVIMFYGEEIDYRITEYSDEHPQGKVVDNYSVRISEKNVYNDESRFGMINGMMICKDLGREEAAREMMQSYELCKVSGRELFKLL